MGSLKLTQLHFIPSKRSGKIMLKSVLSFKGTIQPGLRLVPSENFVLALKRSHHFLLKRVSI